MNSQGPKSSKPRRKTSQWQGSPKVFSSVDNSFSCSPITSHMAMVELKQNILASLSKLADRDTYEIAISDLESTIRTISQDAIPMLLNCLFDSSNHPKPSVKKESIRLLPLLCITRGDSMVNHLTKIITHISRRLKDSDSTVRYACRDAIGALSSQYMNNECVVGLFAKPLFEAMNENNKNVQANAAICMAEMVVSVVEPPPTAFRRLCLKICKFLNKHNFLGKAALLAVVSSLSQVGAIAPQSFPSLLRGIQECLMSPDWATRKAAAEALTSLLLHSTNLMKDEDLPTLTVLESCRFDKVKPVRDSVMEALQLWKKIFGKADKGPDDLKHFFQESKNQNFEEIVEKIDMDPGDLCSKDKGVTIVDKAMSILKKKAPALTGKELNADFFKKHETWGFGDFPIEVVVPHGYHSSSTSNNENYASPAAEYGMQMSYHLKQHNEDKNWRLSAFDDEIFEDKEKKLILGNAVKFNSHFGNLVSIQRQLLQLKRKQMKLMDILQDFMGGSHNEMLALENRVKCVERAVEDMVRDFSISSGRTSSSFVVGTERSTYKSMARYNDYYSGNGPSMREMNMQWGYDRSLTHNISSSSNNNNNNNNKWRNGKTSSTKALLRSKNVECASTRRVWKASKDEETLEAIRVDEEDGVDYHGAARDDGEDMEVGNVAEDAVWGSWGNAMDALEVGDIDAAYAEVLSTEDDVLLVKLMQKSGVVVDQLSCEVAAKVLHAIAQMMIEPNLSKICLCWIQQLVMLEKGGNGLVIPDEVKKEMVLNLQQTCSSTTMESPLARGYFDDVVPDQLLLQLASSWHINLPKK